jgi:hypothetical protein
LHARFDLDGKPVIPTPKLVHRERIEDWFEPQDTKDVLICRLAEILEALESSGDTA